MKLHDSWYQAGPNPTTPHTLSQSKFDKFFMKSGDKSVGSNGISSRISHQHVLRLWPDEHFAAGLSRLFRSRQVVWLLPWMDSKLFKSWRAVCLPELQGIPQESKRGSCTYWTWLLSMNKYSQYCSEKRVVRCSFSLFRCAEMPRKGSGAQCQKCPANTFSNDYSSGKLCNPCPAGSKSSEGSTSQSSCMCEVGVLDNSTGSLALLQPCQLGAMFPPQKNVWFFERCESVFKSLEASNWGSADVQRTKPSPWTLAWNATTCSWTAEVLDQKSTRPVPCQTTRAWTTRAARTSACRRQADAMPTSPTLWAKSRGYPIWRLLLSIYHLSMFHEHSLEHLQYVLLNDTCDLWYLVLVRLETNQDPGGAGCAAGYAAPMCIQCNHDFFSHGQQCERCRTSDMVSSAVVVAAAILALAGLGAAFIWHRLSTEGHPTKPSCWTALTQQAKAQVPILLQLCGLAIAINLIAHMPWREWNEHMFYAAIEIGSRVVLFQWALLYFVVPFAQLTAACRKASCGPFLLC